MNGPTAEPALAPQPLTETPASRCWALAFVWSNPPLLASATALFHRLQSLANLETHVVTDDLDGKLYLLSQGISASTVSELLTPDGVEAAWPEETTLNALLDRAPHGQLEAALGTMPTSVPSRRTSVLRRLVRAYEQALVRTSAGCVFVWNGWLPIPAALTLAASQHKVPTFYLERGLLPGTLTIDPAGVNYGSELAGASWRRLPAPAADKATCQRIDSLAQHLATTGDTVVRKGKTLSRQASRAQLGINNDERLVLVPLQLETDSNIVAYSPLFKRMADFSNAVRDALQNQPRVVMAVRPHPEAREAAVLGADTTTPRVIAGDQLSLHSFLAASDVVVTINSTVGLEATLQAKPVVVVGQAIYGEKGFTFDVRALDELADRIGEALVHRTLPEAMLAERNRFLAYLLRQSLFSLGPTDPWDSHATIASNLRARLEPVASAAWPSMFEDSKALIHLLSPTGDPRSLLVLAPDGGNGLSRALCDYVSRHAPQTPIELLARKKVFTQVVGVLLGRYRGGLTACRPRGKRGALWRALPITKADLVRHLPEP